MSLGSAKRREFSSAPPSGSCSPRVRGLQFIPSATWGLRCWRSSRAYAAADWASGLAHWSCDTFFEEDTPLVGPAVIQPFREHHRDPLAMTRHGFLELNGSNCLRMVVPLAVAVWLCPPRQKAGPNLLDVLLRVLLPGSCRDQSSPRMGARRIRTPSRRPLASATRPHLVAGASRRSSPSTICASLLRHARVDESAARSREIFRTRRSSADATWRTKSARIVTLTLTRPAPCARLGVPCALCPVPCALCPAPCALP